MCEHMTQSAVTCIRAPAWNGEGGHCYYIKKGFVIVITGELAFMHAKGGLSFLL